MGAKSNQLPRPIDYRLIAQEASFTSVHACVLHFTMDRGRAQRVFHRALLMELSSLPGECHFSRCRRRYLPAYCVRTSYSRVSFLPFVQAASIIIYQYSLQIASRKALCSPCKDEEVTRQASHHGNSKKVSKAIQPAMLTSQSQPRQFC